jgi:hypothetical protein
VVRWQIVAAAATSIAASALLGSAAPANSPNDMVLTSWRGAATESRANYQFEIKASSVKGLHPGSRAHVALRIENPYPFDLRVFSLKGELVGTSRRGCRPTGTNLEVRPYRGTLPLAVRGRREVSAGYLDLHMPNTVVDACQRTTFTIRISGLAAKASR